jgi:hypothetical protein
LDCTEGRGEPLTFGLVEKMPKGRFSMLNSWSAATGNHDLSVIFFGVF